MKKSNSLYIGISALLFSVSVGAMNHVPSAFVEQAHFTGPVTMDRPTMTQTTNHNYNRYANFDFTGGNPQAGFIRKVLNAARDSVPALVYHMPTSFLQIATQVAATLLTHKAAEWLMNKGGAEVSNESDGSKMQKIDALVVYFTDKLAHLSVNTPEYSETKQKIELLKGKYKELEDNLCKKVYADILK